MEKKKLQLKFVSALALLLSITCFVSAWDDHPDRDFGGIESTRDIPCNCEESRIENDKDSFDNGNRGNMDWFGVPDRDK